MPLSRLAKELIDGPNFATLATIMPDGSPQASTMWIDRQGDTVRLNTAVGRVKHKNLHKDARVAISIFAMDDPYVDISLRGKVVHETTEGAVEHIHALANKYLGRDYPWLEQSPPRITLLVEIDQDSGD
jgi:PPOX class probable F420-dependent enzyme